MVAQLDLRLDPVLEGGQPELVEAGDLVLQEALEREVGERRPAPQRERVAQCGRALCGRQRPCVADEPLEPTGVDRPRVEAQHVPGRACLDQVPTE